MCQVLYNGELRKIRPPYTWIMRVNVASLAFFISVLASAETRDASLYPAHLALGERTLAAEYLARSIPVPGGSLLTEDYLVIDVAWFGPKYDSFALSSSHFTLRMNGRKTPILTQTPGLVAASLKYA